MTKTPNRFRDVDSREPVDNPNYKLGKLNTIEKLIIRMVYWKEWRGIVRRSRMSRNQQKFAKIYFQELHVRYYTAVVRGSSYVTTPRLIKNYFISKSNENLRAVISSLRPYNLTSFVHGIRSQVELNALINRFIKDPDYHRLHMTLNEDRKLIKEHKTVINVNTLVGDLHSTVIPYKQAYDSLSLLLHPNPSAIKFYAQAEGTPTEDKSGVFHPKIKFYFDETITHCEDSSRWFFDQTWLFLTCIEHFLILFEQLNNDFYVSESEKSQHELFAMTEFMRHYEKQLLKTANIAERNGEDVGEAVNSEMARLLAESRKPAEASSSPKPSDC